MNIAIITPATAPILGGNRNTAQRWARLLRVLGHRARVQACWDGRRADAMIALHARKSCESIKKFSVLQPDQSLILCLTGTDLYRDIKTDASARESLQLASRIIVLQEMGLQELSPELRRKTRVIYQSAKPVKPTLPLKNCFEICIIGHLREEKDPFRCVMALQHLPPSSRIRVSHMGRAMTGAMEKEARRWMAREPRYQWLGEIPHRQARRRLARSRAMVISSRMEGGANVISEALMARVPIIASSIRGNIGMLGADYSGYYPLGDERRLALLLQRVENDPAFRRLLNRQCKKRLPLIQEKTEKNSLKRLLAELD
ncbi:MAG TPA: selenoneine biosynthesis selenosugar synthase SenB [Burkholderiales bacterium]|nr:selenoneine biosynthesis selenosugar synthase SenB [Burkholderiales bacterium]